MKKSCFTLALLLCAAFACAQQSRTFTIENLEVKDGLLPVKPYEQILKNLLLSEKGDHTFDDNNFPGFPYNIVAHSNIKDSLVYYGYHPFFNGMYEAYANHHPFTLSPDMIWLLIAQGFAHHVNAHAEELRSMFVDFKGKMTLVVENDAIRLDNPNSPWEEVFPEFVQKIGENTGKDIVNTLTPDFTTTTPTDRLAADITIMEAMKEYFEFIVTTSMCGIPAVTLEGTPADWQKIVDKVQALRKYKLDWWINKIEPPLKQFVGAAKGNIDTAFWRNMFKQHTAQSYGKPKIIDGWVVGFFPYDKDGHQLNLDSISQRRAGNLPDEMVKVDLKHIQIFPSGKSITTPLELWAGFAGLRQDKQTFGLRPETGWMVRKKDTTNDLVQTAFSKMDKDADYIMIRVRTVPLEILKLKAIDELEIHFIDKVVIPDEMAAVEIHELDIYGDITIEEIRRIRKLLPNTRLLINGKDSN